MSEFKQSQSSDLADLPDAVEHCIYPFYSLDGEEICAQWFEERCLFDFVSTPAAGGRRKQPKSVHWLPREIQQALLDEGGYEPVWKNSNLTISADLLPNIHQCLGNHPGTTTRVFELSDPALRIVNGRCLAQGQSPARNEQPSFQLTLKLRSSGTRRVQSIAGADFSGEIPLLIEQVHLIWFSSTRHAIVIPRLRIRSPKRLALHPYLIAETVANLQRFNQLVWNAESVEPPAKPGESVAARDKPSTTLAQIVRVLAGCRQEAEPADRAFIHSFVRFGECPAAESLEHFACLLARQYTRDYQIDAQLLSEQIVRDFHNVVHAISSEGGSTLVAPSSDQPGIVEFLKNFRTHAFEPVYLQLALLAQHNSQVLHRLKSSMLEVSRDYDQPTLIRVLDRIRREILIFRLHFVFPRVSVISMHNRVNEALRAAMFLDQEIEQLDRDSAEIGEYLSAQHQAQMEHKMKWVHGIGAAGAAYVTVFTIVKEFLEISEKLHWFDHPAQYEWTTPAAALLSAIFAFWLAVRKAKASASTEAFSGAEIREHLVHENILHQMKN